jgi:hypothetical protein
MTRTIRYKAQLLFFVIVLLQAFSLWGMVFDNRFIPLLAKPLYRLPSRCNFFAIQPFFMVGNRAWGEFGEFNSLQEEFGLHEWHGKYDQRVIDSAIVTAGLSPTSLLRSDFQLRSSIPWGMEGELHTIGFALYGYSQISSHFGVGGSWVFMHANGTMELVLDHTVLDPGMQGDERELLMAKERMHRLLGVRPGLWRRTGSGDLDLYVRFGTMTEYRLKMRRIDAGIKFGGIIPLAAPIDINNPASITFGGNKHPGFYVSFEAEAELKEDLRAGLMLRLIKRFSRTQLARVPVLTEPDIFGALVTPLRVDPGLTLAFSPYVAFDEVRDGLGFFVQYTVVAHAKDEIEDIRSMPIVPINVRTLMNRSSWMSEYVTIGIGYDVHASREVTWWLPRVTFLWDIPVNPMVSKRSNKTNAVSLLAKFDF